MVSSDTYSSSSLSTNSSGKPPRNLSVRDLIPLTISDWSTRASTVIPAHQRQQAIDYLNSLAIRSLFVSSAWNRG
jgi:hypothetical protein